MIILHYFFYNSVISKGKYINNVILIASRDITLIWYCKMSK